MKNLSTAFQPCILVALLSVVSGCAHFTHQQHRDQAQQNWDQVRAKIKLQLATQRYETGHPEDAARLAAEAVTLDPGCGDGYTLLIRSNMESGDLSAAQRALCAARQAGFNSTLLTYLEGVLHEQRGEFVQAMGCYRQAGAMNSEELDYLVAEVECTVAAGDPEAALRLIRENRRRLDRDGTLATLGAGIAEMLGDTLTAERMYRAAIRDSGSRSLSLDYGLMLVRHDRCAEARVVLEPLLAGGGGTLGEGALRRSLARCHLALGNPSAAAGVLQDYARTHRDDQAAQLLVAAAALMLDDHHTASRSANAVLDQNPRDRDALLVLATVRNRRDRDAAARSPGKPPANQPNDAVGPAMGGEVQAK